MRSSDGAKSEGVRPGWQTGSAVLTAPQVFPFKFAAFSEHAATSKCSMMRG